MRMVVWLCTEDRQATGRHLWVLRHLIAFKLHADEYVHESGLLQSSFGLWSLWKALFGRSSTICFRRRIQ